MVWIALMIGIGLIVILIGTIVMYKVKKERIEPDYRTLFILGIIFMGTGSAMISTLGTSSMGMFALGLIYMAVGIANKDKWKKQPESLSMKNKRIIIAVLLGTCFVVALTVWLVLAAPL